MLRPGLPECHMNVSMQQLTAMTELIVRIVVLMI